MKRWKQLFGLLLFLLLATSCQRDVRPRVPEEQLRKHVSYLASDQLEGRDTGTEGVRLAENYVASVFREAGLPPLPGEPDYFLEFPLYHRGYDPSGTTLVISCEGEAADGIELGAEARAPLTAELGVDFKPFSFSGTGEARGELVFAGYGITAPEHDYDDYQGLGVEGKTVLVFRHEPNEMDPNSVFSGTAMTRHALFTEKATNAQRHGAQAMILITDPLHHPHGDDLRADGVFSLNPSADGARFLGNRMKSFPSLHVSRDLIRRCLEPRLKIEDLQKALDSGQRPSDFALPPLSVSLGVALDAAAEDMESRNVAAYLEGRDSKEQEEIIIVGAHHDHIGSFEGAGDTIYNGADDNASGTAAVLSLAEAFAEVSTRASANRARRLPRSLVFVTFAAEEEGLFGSQVLLEQWRFPSKKIVFMLNLDMLGRNPEGDIEAAVRPGRFRELLEEANADSGLPLAFRGDSEGNPSDAGSFRRSGIPTLFLTTGLHEDYHRVTDHADRIEYPRMNAIVELCYRFIEAVAKDADDGNVTE